MTGRSSVSHRPRILQLCAVDFTVRNFLVPLIEGLEARGFEVWSACSPGPYFPELRRRGLRMIEMPIDRSLNAFKHTVSTLRLWRYLRRHPFDLIHVHTPIASLIGRLAGRLADTPIRIYTAHGFYFHDDMPARKRRFHIALERMGARWGHFIFLQSEEDRQTALKVGIAREDRSLTIGNGVDVWRFDPSLISEEKKIALRDELRIPRNARVICMIGRLAKEKGYFEFFDAASRLAPKYPDLRFMVIGDALAIEHDNVKAEIADRIKRLGLEDRVVFAGFRPDIPELLSLTSLYTLPSWREGMPRSIIEAMSMALPVVATNIRGCREEVIEGETGHLVPTRDSRSLAEAWQKLLDDPARAREMGQAGRERALREYDEQLVIERQVKVYYQLMREKAVRLPEGVE